MTPRTPQQQEALALVGRDLIENPPRMRKLTVEVPEPLFQRLVEIAEQLRRPGRRRTPLGRIARAALAIGTPRVAATVPDILALREQQEEAGHGR
jgi:hypothetical protein